MAGTYAEDKIQPIIELLEELKKDSNFGPYESFIEIARNCLLGVVRRYETDETRKVQLDELGMTWKRVVEYSGFPRRNLGKLRVLAQHVGVSQFNIREARLSAGGSMFTYSNPFIYRLVSTGILERKPRDLKSFYYRFVPEALRDLGVPVATE